MSAKIIQTITRPSLEHIFFTEWRSDEFWNDNDLSDADHTQPLTITWLEEISFEEIAHRRHDLREDWVVSLFNQDGLSIINPIYTPIVNPFSLTDTRIRIFNSESDMRNSISILKHVPRYHVHIDDIRRLNNIITLQIFIDEELVETIEFK
jgi:hypothetical protein